MAFAAITRWRHWRRLRAAAVLIAAAIIADRPTHLPAAEQFAATWTAGAVEELALTPVKGSTELLSLQSGAGDGVVIEGGPVMLDGETPRRASKIAWSVAPSKQSTGSKVQVRLTMPGDREGSLVMARAGETYWPQIAVGSATLPLRLDAGLVFEPADVMPSVSFVADDDVLASPDEVTEASTGVSFTLLPGGSLSLTFPKGNDNSDPAGLVTLAGAQGPRGSRLQLREIALRSEGDPLPKMSACAARRGATLWSALLRASARPAGEDCATDRSIALTRLSIGTEGITVRLAGAGYVTSDEAATARWLRWARDNLVVAAFMATALGALAIWALREMFSAPAPAPAPVPAAAEPRRTKPKRQQPR